jgi:D-lyxose ketol-isomerase
VKKITDIKVSLAMFKRLIQYGHFNGAIFESAEYLMTSVGALTVYATKISRKKIFTKKNGWKITSYPFLKSGYMGISTFKTKPLSDEETVNQLIAEFADYSKEDLEKLQKAINELLERIRGEETRQN